MCLMLTMAYFPDYNHVQTALVRTQDALRMSANLPLSIDEAGVFLKYLLLEGLDNSEIRNWRVSRRVDAGVTLRRNLEGLLRDIVKCMNTTGGLAGVSGVEWINLQRFLLTSTLYRNRLIDLALEALLSEPLAAELCIKPASSTAHEFSLALPGSWNHAVIFASPIFFTHEFYPLVVDAYVHDNEYFGSPRINVLGGHVDWLTENGQLKRILYLDFKSGRFIETGLDVPVQSDSVQFLCMGNQEQEKHAAMSGQFKCDQVNPALVSRLADDKVATLVGWSALGLAVPVYQEIVPGDLKMAFGFLDRFSEIVVKPNQGTEGEQVAFFQRAQLQVKELLEAHLISCWQKGVAIVQQRRDGVFFYNPILGINQTLALRLNVAFDGERYYLESGYAQLGQDEGHPASCGRGGQIIPIDEALSSLTYRNKAIRIKSKDWGKIRMQAERAADLFRGLMLMGLDILLDYDNHGNIIPVFLEANPRPAGLSHSRLLTDDPYVPAPIGVSLKLWEGLNQKQRKGLPTCLS